MKNNPLSRIDPSGYGEKDSSTDCNSNDERNPDCGDGNGDGGGDSSRPEEVIVERPPIPPLSAVQLILNPLPFDPHAGSTPQMAQDASGGGGSAVGGAENQQDAKCKVALVEVGNRLARASDFAEMLSTYVVAGGAVIAASGVVVPGAAVVGFRTMQVGGYLGTVAGSLHLLAGFAHGVGGAGWENAKNGAAILVTGRMLERGIAWMGPSVLPGMSAAQRAAHELSQRVGAVTGLAYDTGTNAIPHLGPRQESCD